MCEKKKVIFENRASSIMYTSANGSVTSGKPNYMACEIGDIAKLMVKIGEKDINVDVEIIDADGSNFKGKIDKIYAAKIYWPEGMVTGQPVEFEKDNIYIVSKDR